MPSVNDKVFGDYLKDFFSYDVTGNINSGLANTDITGNIWNVADATAKQAGQYGAAALSSTESAGKNLFGSAASAYRGQFTDAAKYAYGASKDISSAKTYLGGATIGSFATPIDIAVMGTLSAVAPKAVEPLAEGMEKLYDLAGGTLEARARIDTIIGGLGAAGIAGGFDSLSKIGKSVKGLSMSEAITKSLSTVEPPKADVLSSIADSLAKTKEATGRVLSTYDIVKAAEDAGVKVPDNFTSAIPNRTLSGIPEAVYNQVGERTSLNKATQKAILDNLSAQGIGRSKAGTYIKNVLRENQRLADKGKPLDVQIRDALDVVATKAELGEDVALSPYKYDAEDGVVGNAYKLLEENNIVDRTPTSDGKYSFTWGEDASKYVDEKTMQRTAQGLAYYPMDMYDRLKSASNDIPTQSFDEVAAQKFDEAIDNPLESPKILNRIEEAAGDVNQLKRPSTNNYLHSQVTKAMDDLFIEGKAISKADEANIRALGTRLGIPTDQIFAYGGGIDKAKAAEVLKLFDDAKLNGFKDVTSLPVPKTLSSMLRRDSAVAKRAFSRGVNEEKVVADRKIAQIRERNKNASEAQKAEGARQIEAIKSKYQEKTDWRGNLKQTIREQLPKNTPSSVAKSLYKIADGVNSYAGYEKAVDKIAYGVQRAQAKDIANQISEALQPYKRAAGKTTAKNRKIGAEERIALENKAKALAEIMAEGVDRYNLTGDISALKDTLHDIKNIEKIGIERFKDNLKLTQEQVQATIAEATKDGLNEIGTSTIDDRLSTSGNFQKQFFKALDPNIQIRDLFKNDSGNTALQKFYEVNEADRQVQLLQDKFVKEVAEPLDKAGWISKGKARELGIYLITKQSDWSKKVFDENGSFIGKNIFPFISFDNEAAYTKYIDDIRKDVESNPKVVDALKKAEELRNQIDDKSRTAALLYDKYMYGRIEGYYPQRAIRSGKPMEWADNLFTGEAEGFKRGYQEERAYDKQTQYDPDFFDDYMRYVNTQGRYGEMRGVWGQFMDLVNGGLLKDTNNYTRNLVEAAMQDYAKPSPLESNWFSKASGRVAKITLAMRVTSWISQFLAVPESIIRTRPSFIVQGSFAALRPKVRLAALDASSTLKLASNGGMLINELQSVHDATSAGKFFDKIVNAANVPIGKSDAGSKYAVWLSAYTDRYNQKYGNKFDFNNPEFTDKDIVLHADDVVESVVGTKTFARLPKAMRSPYARGMLMLQSFVLKRMGQIIYELPRKFRDNPQQASAALASYAVTGVLPLFIGSSYKESLEQLADMMGMDWYGDEKTMAERMTGKKDATMADILLAAGKTQLTGIIPGTSNVISIANYDNTGIGLFDYLKKPYDKISAARTSSAQGDEGGATAASIDAISSMLGEPGRIAGELAKGALGVTSPNIFNATIVSPGKSSSGGSTKKGKNIKRNVQTKRK